MFAEKDDVPSKAMGKASRRKKGSRVPQNEVVQGCRCEDVWTFVQKTDFAKCVYYNKIYYAL